MITDPDFHARYGPWAIVAGASEGIGRAYAHQLAEKGLDLILIARRREKLEDEAHLLRRRHGVKVESVSMDLGSADLETRLRETVADRDVGLVIYNACHSTIGRFLETDLESQLLTLDVNCRGPLIVSKVIAPRLVARGRGGILLMSSMSGEVGTAMVTSYAASKAFDTNFGEGLWAELSPLGVDVLVCVAGATLTPNFKDNTPADRRSMALPMKPEDVARGALRNLGNGPVHYAGKVNATVAAAMRITPRSAAVSFMSGNTRKLYE